MISISKSEAKTAWISVSVSTVLVVAGQGHRQGLPSAGRDVISAAEPGQCLCCQISPLRLSLVISAKGLMMM